MQKFYFPLFFFLAVTVSATAQSAANGKNSPSAPVNVADPALRPAQPAQYSATPVQNGGQFYVTDDKPANAGGQTLVPLTPAEREKLLNRKPGNEKAQPADKPTSNQKGN